MRTTCRSWDEGKAVQLGPLIANVEAEGFDQSLLRAMFERVGLLKVNQDPELEREFDSVNLVMC
jgi:hypothetical protein